MGVCYCYHKKTLLINLSTNAVLFDFKIKLVDPGACTLQKARLYVRGVRLDPLVKAKYIVFSVAQLAQWPPPHRLPSFQYWS